MSHTHCIERLETPAYRIPTDAPEADGTLAWDSTTLVLVRVAAGGVWGCGYSYTDAAASGAYARKQALDYAARFREQARVS